MVYETLDHALDDIATRSFYESARVSKVEGGYEVEDWHTGVEESVPWTYETGAQVGDVLDHSRTHEPYEYYSEAQHIRYNLPTAVAAIEEGTPVGFTYVIAEEERIDDGNEYYEGVGWLLIATEERI